MSDSNVYTAERILAKRKYRGVTQYYIKWKGYSIKDSTWEPTENIFDPGLIEAFENGRSYRSSASMATILNSSGASTNSSLQESQSSTSTSRSSTKRGRGRPRKSYSQQRQEQVRLQRHIEQQQQQKTHPSNTTSSTSTPTTTVSAATTAATVQTTKAAKALQRNNNNNTDVSEDAVPQLDTKPQLIVFNPQGRQAEQAVIEEIAYEPELTKEPILVTDVTSKDLTVTISECKTPEGFFRT